MLNFLEGVRLIKVQAGNGTPEPGSERIDTGGTTVQIDPKTGSVNVHKHSSGGDGILAVPIVAIIFTFLYLIIKAIMAPFTNRARQAQAVPASGGLSEEEVAILHKLQRTLSQMESRVEALETILIDQARTEKHYGSKL